MDDRATLSEGNLIHEGSDQIDPATVRPQSIVWGRWIRDRIMLKSVTFILDRYRDISIRRTTAIDVNALARIVLVPVNDGIHKRFAQRQFNFIVAFVFRLDFRNEPNELVHERRDNLDVTGKDVAQPNEGSTAERFRVARTKSSLCHVCGVQLVFGFRFLGHGGLLSECALRPVYMQATRHLHCIENTALVLVIQAASSAK